MKLLVESSNQSRYPIVAVRDGIVFPSTENVLLFGREKSVLAVNEGLQVSGNVVVVLQKNPNINDPLKEDLYPIGVLVTHRFVRICS